MKKLLCLLVALVMMLSCFSALAEEPVESAETTEAGDTAFESVTGLYTCTIPSNYTVITAEMVESIRNMITADNLSETYDMDAETAQQFIDAVASLDLTAGDYLWDDTFTSNINVQVTKDTGMTAETLAQSAESQMQAITEQYTAYGVAEEDCDPVGMIEIEGSPYAWLQYNVVLMDSEISQYIAVDGAGNAFIFTFTKVDEDVARSIIASVVFAN